MGNKSLLRSLMNILFIISTGAMCAGLSANGMPVFRFTGCFAAIVISVILIYRFDFVSKAFENLGIPIKILLAYSAAMLSAYNQPFGGDIKKDETVKAFLLSYPRNITMCFDIILVLIQIASIWAFFVFLCWGYKQLKPVGTFLAVELKGQYKYGLVVGVVSLGLLVIYNLTCAFTYPVDIHGKFQAFEVIYTTDSGANLLEDSYFNFGMYSNGVKKPLFTLFTLPFSLPAKILSKLLYFIPNAYIWLIMTFQYAMLCIVILLLAKLLRLQKKTAQLFFVYMAASYPFMLFTITAEQYTASIFWLILLLYAYCAKADIDGRLLFTGAAGSLITSSITFPFVLKSKEVKQWFGELIKLGAVFLSAVVLCGKLPYLFSAVTEIKSALSSFGGVATPMIEKLKLYSHFVSCCFIAPKAAIVEDIGKLRIAYRMVYAENFNAVGLVALVIVIIGFVLTRKQILSMFCGGWVVFSVFVLVIMGWGVVEKNPILYSLYFSWAYLVLAYQALKAVLGRFKLVYRVISAVACVGMFGYNLYGIIEIIRFSITYYPA